MLQQSMSLYQDVTVKYDHAKRVWKKFGIKKA